MPEPDLIALQAEPLDLAQAAGHVACADAGGVSIFIGTTRAETHPDAGPLVALEYTAYPEMTLQECRKIVREARTQWEIAHLALLHRVGQVALGQPSVVIAVSCAHRGPAFAACRYVIDQVKARAPIWKREIYTRTARWQGDQAPPPASAPSSP